MADNKKYYYMRLKENFFNTDEMVYLEGLEEGYLFSNILLKLYLRSLKNDGVLMMNEAIPYDARMISKFTGHSLSTVEKALFEFKKLKLIEVLDSGQMYMSNIELFVGKASTEADRKREARKNIEKKIEIGTNVGQMSDERSPEKELELELELEKDIKTIVHSNESTTDDDNKKSEQLEDLKNKQYFESWWNLYGNKKNRKGCEKKFPKVLKEFGAEILAEKTKEYVEAFDNGIRDRQYQQHPDTFLNQFHPDNDYSYKQNNNFKGGKQNGATNKKSTFKQQFGFDPEEIGLL